MVQRFRLACPDIRIDLGTGGFSKPRSALLAEEIDIACFILH